MLLLGDEHIFKMALGLLNLLESKLLAVGDLGEMVSILKELMHSPILFEVRPTLPCVYVESECFDV